MDSTLRNRKKAETKLAIYDAAYRLFRSKGYTKTTLSEIAAAANVSQRTIFSYYPSKEAIIFEKQRQLIDDLFYHIELRGNQTVFEAIRSYDMPTESTQFTSTTQQLLNLSPELQEYSSQLHATLESRLVELIARENNLSINTLQAHLLAASCRTLITYLMDNKSDTTALEIGLKYIESGLKATVE